MKRPFNSIMDIALWNNRNFLKLFVESAKSQRTFVTWLVGFSFAAISLMLTYKTDLLLEISITAFRVSYVGLVLSITSGIINIYLLDHYFVLNHRAAWLLETRFSDENVMNIHGPELNESMTINEIIRGFKQDFDMDYSNLQEIHSNLGDSQRQRLIKDLVANYSEFMAWGERDIERAMNHLKKSYSEVFDKSEYDIEKLFNKSLNPTVMKRLEFWIKWTFTIHIGTFILTLLCSVGFVM